jgi:hypothetical protein
VDFTATSWSSCCREGETINESFWEISWRQQKKMEVGFKNLKNCYQKKENWE